eukprot:scaffold588_cov139-Skeletonema_menzelii.AAC.6
MRGEVCGRCVSTGGWGVNFARAFSKKPASRGSTCHVNPGVGVNTLSGLRVSVVSPSVSVKKYPSFDSQVGARVIPEK